MRIEGGARLRRKLADLPAAQRRHIKVAQQRNGADGVRVAKTLVPRDRGVLADSIEAKEHDGGMTVVIVAGDETKRGKIQAHAVEGGRDAGTRGGAMDAQPYIGPTRAYLAKRFKGRIRRAINKAVKEVARRG